ncbi:MAG: hypothetical protein IT384_23675 [Deltaproteobacteria bacterium]|nr:hypothetical protein [Deltaproteobacteria bacterium]
MHAWMLLLAGEVRDKIVHPWDIQALLFLGLAMGSTAALAISPSRVLRAASWLFAVLHGMLRFMLEPYADRDVGPVLRAELSSVEHAVYLAVLAIEMLAPLAVAAWIQAGRRAEEKEPHR